MDLAAGIQQSLFVVEDRIQKGTVHLTDKIEVNAEVSHMGGSRVYLTFALGELAAGDFFYYMSNYHGKLRAEAMKKVQP